MLLGMERAAAGLLAGLAVPSFWGCFGSLGLLLEAGDATNVAASKQHDA
jgi:hypothetical protein